MMVLLFLITSSFAQIEGHWMTADKKGIIEINKVGDTYQGQVIGGEQQGDGLDRKNPDESLRMRPLMGLIILTDLKQDEDDKKYFTGGKIYDPNSGNTYKCKATLTEKDELELRGYVGFSLFGRTEVWTRRPKSSAASESEKKR